jgi:hypothetical protein
MKKSTKVVLSLLVPAMAAYGCSNQTKTVQAPANAASASLQNRRTIPMHCSCGHRFTVGSEMVGATVQCPNCDRTLQVSEQGSRSSSYRRGYRSSSSSFFPGWFGGYTTQPSDSPPPVATSTRTSESRHTYSSGNVSNSGHVSYSGFGGTGSRFSGGS